MIVQCAKSPNCISIDATWHPTQGRDTLVRDNHSPPVHKQVCRQAIGLVGTVPQTDVLMVTHERNMRSKIR